MIKTHFIPCLYYEDFADKLNDIINDLDNKNCSIINVSHSAITSDLHMGPKYSAIILYDECIVGKAIRGKLDIEPVTFMKGEFSLKPKCPEPISIKEEDRSNEPEPPKCRYRR